MLSFVVKNGSKILARVAASIPQPESATERTTNGPAASSVGTCSGSTFAVLIVSVPPAGMASRAFRARLTSTCSTWPGSACTSPRSAPSAVTTSMCSPIRRCSILFVSTTIVFRSTMRGCSTCLRPKARSCCVSDAARCAACSIASTSARRPTSRASRLPSRKPLCTVMTVSRLLKSCATPPARRPTASSFCAWYRRSSSCLRSLTSCTIPTVNSGLPSASRTTDAVR